MSPLYISVGLVQENAHLRGNLIQWYNPQPHHNWAKLNTKEVLTTYHVIIEGGSEQYATDLRTYLGTVWQSYQLFKVAEALGEGLIQ